jgi:tripartite-type tricarboxylate transporter receptor subunit TctC
MMSKLPSSVVTALLFALSAAFPGPAQAQPKVTRLVVPYPAGGPVDVIARLVAQKLAEVSGRTVVVDNRGGANGFIGVEMVARAAPDGATLVMGSTSTHSINPLIYLSVPYDAVRDFAPVALLGTRPYILVVHPSIPATSVRELIALARANPGKLTYASGGGVGSANHLASEMFKVAARVDILHVPYKGGGPALTDVLGGQVAIFFAPIPTALPHVQTGKLRALAVTGVARSPVAPQLPTMAMAGLPGFEFSVWDGIFAPAKTQSQVIGALNADIVKVVQMPDLRDKLAAMGVDASGSTPEQLAAYLKADTAKWAKVLKDSGIKAE